MSDVSNSRIPLRFLLSLILLAVLVKFSWVILEAFFLPLEGVERDSKGKISSLGQRYKLASNETLPKVVKKKKKPSKPTVTLRDLKLLAIYKGPKHTLAVIQKGSKPSVVKEGDVIFGYKVEEIHRHWVRLHKGMKAYRLDLQNGKKIGFSRSYPTLLESKSEEIQKEGEITIVPRSLLQTYAKNLKKIFQEVAIAPQKERGRVKGFLIKYVKKGSIFEKLGITKGDVIVAINGEEIKDYALAMELFQSIGSLEELILTIKRGDKEMELEYEVR